MFRWNAATGSQTMMNGMMDGGMEWMMWGMRAFWLLLIILVVLAVAALLKNLFRR